LENKDKFYNRIEELLCSFILIAMLVLLSVQVFGRFILNYSNSWSEEATRYLFVWFVYLGASYAVYKEAHIKLDGAMNLFPKGTRKYIELLGNVIFLVYCIVLFYFSAKYTAKINAAGQVSLGLGIKMSLVYLSIPFCHLLMAVRLLVIIYKKTFHKNNLKG